MQLIKMSSLMLERLSKSRLARFIQTGKKQDLKYDIDREEKKNE